MCSGACYVPHGIERILELRDDADGANQQCDDARDRAHEAGLHGRVLAAQELFDGIAATRAEQRGGLRENPGARLIGTEQQTGDANRDQQNRGEGKGRVVGESRRRQRRAVSDPFVVSLDQ